MNDWRTEDGWYIAAEASDGGAIPAEMFEGACSLALRAAGMPVARTAAAIAIHGEAGIVGWVRAVRRAAGPFGHAQIQARTEPAEIAAPGTVVARWSWGHDGRSIARTIAFHMSTMPRPLATSRDEEPA